MRRPIQLLLALALAIPAADGAVHETLRAAKRVQPVELERLVAAPEQYQTNLVRFRCSYGEMADLFDPLSATFRPELHFNIAVWDDTARVWDADVRGKPLLTVYVPKDLPAAALLGSLRKFEQIDVTGVVTQVSSGVPWIEVTRIDRVEGAGSLSDRSVYHLQQGMALANDGVRDLAEQHFARAQADELPVFAEVSVRELRARQIAAAGREREAIDLLTEALSLADTEGSGVDDAQRAQLHALLAKCQNEAAAAAPREQRQALLAASVDHARSSLRYDPALADAYAVLGISLAGLGQFDEARRECDNALRLRPNDAEVRWYLGRILDQQGKYDEAIDALKKAIDLTPKDARIHKAIANAYYHRGLKGGPSGSADLTTALREYDIALRLNPGDPEAIYASGLALEAAAEAGAEVPVAGGGRQAATKEMAVERYRAAIATDEAFAPAHRALADVLRDQSKHEDALAHYVRVAELQPDDFASVSALASFYESQNRRDAAISLYEQFLSKHSQHPQARVALFRLHQAAGNHQRAQDLQKNLDEQLKKQPKNPSVLLAAAEFRLAGGDAKSAADLAARAYDQADASGKIAAAATMGKAKWELGDAKGTIASLAPIADQTSDEAARVALAWAYIATNKPQHARPIADRLRTSEAGGVAAELIGWTSYLAGDYAQAEQTLRRAPIRDATVKAYRLGMAIFKQGPSRHQDARPYLLAARSVGAKGGMFANASREVNDALKAMGADVGSEPTGAIPAPAPADDQTAKADEAKRLADAEAARQADEAKRAEDAKRAADAEAKRVADADAARNAAEAEAKRVADAEAKRVADAEAAKKAADAEAQRLAAAEAAKKAAEAEAKKVADAEAAKKAAADAEAAKKVAAEAEAKKAAEAEAKRLADAEAAKKAADAKPADDGAVAQAAAAGKAKWEADDAKGTIEALAPVADRLADEAALIALGWSYVAENRTGDAAGVAQKLKALPGKTDAQGELQGWVLYLNGDFRGAEQALKKAAIKDPLVKAYRIGMALFKQGQPRYAEARAMLGTGKNVAGRKSLFGNAKAEAEAALKTISGK